MHEKPIALSVFAVFLTLCTTSAFAQEKAGWSMNAGIGGSLIRDRDGDETFDGNGFGYTWGVEYRFGPRWALGMDLFSLGSATDTLDAVETKIDVGGFDMRARLIFPMSENTELFGRLGYVGYFADVDPGGSNFGEEALSLGLGLDVDRDEHWTIRVEGRYFDGPREESGTLLAVGFNYRW